MELIVILSIQFAAVLAMGIILKVADKRKQRRKDEIERRIRRLRNN